MLIFHIADSRFENIAYFCNVLILLIIMVNMNFDFSRPRVRKNGRLLDKFGLALELTELQPGYHWDIIYTAYSYSELRDRLLSLFN